ncbi:MAG: hypothetical protein AAF449_23695 [Myxococcota bacterium]
MNGAGSNFGLQNLLRFGRPSGTEASGIQNGLRSPNEVQPTDPSQMNVKQLIEEIMRLVQQMTEGQQADDKSCCGGKSQGAQGTGNPVKQLEELMEELRQRNPQAVQNAGQNIPGAAQALTAAANATAAASAPVGIPSGFA